MTIDNPIAVGDLPYLDISEAGFSIRSDAVNAAREASWCARTNYGLAVLRYDEVHKLMRDPRLRQGSYAWPRLNGVTGVFASWWERMLLSQEGPNHARLRRLANPAFSPKLVISLRPQFALLANELIDAFCEKGSCEFMADFAEPYATRVICMLLGLSHQKWRELVDLTNDMGLALGVTFKQDLATVDAASSKLFDYVMELVAELRQQELKDDFLSMLVRTNLESDDALSEEELYDLIVLAIFGGIDTTRNQLGLAMEVFIHNPEQWRLLGENPELGKAAVEEVMRIRPTITWVTREAVEDFTYQGLDIKRGTTIHLFGQAAASDPRAYEDPSFNITLERKPHFGFGGGAHFCLGHFIARGDMTEALAILAHRMHNPRIAGEARFLPDSGNTGPIILPVAFDPVERKAFIPPSAVAPAIDGASSDITPSNSAGSLSLTLLYGTQTGNAEQMASDIADIARTRGFAPRVASLDSMSMSELGKLKRLLIATSTYGQGEMPDTAHGFWDALSAVPAPDLAGLSYSLMAMGDTGYETFCQAGRDIDIRLQAAGARPVEPMVECDTNYAATAFAWVDRALAALLAVKGEEDTPLAGAAEPVERVRWSRRNPLRAPLAAITRLTTEGSSKDTRHIELDISGQDCAYEPGDSIGVLPLNDPALVRGLMAHFGLCAHVPVAGADKPIGPLLTEDLEIATPSRELVAEIALRSRDAELNHVLANGDRQSLDAWLRGRDCLDLLRMLPSGGLSVAEFVALLKPLQHRAYSIASSAREHPDRIHLTVSTIRYQSHGRKRGGVASTWLADRLEAGSAVPIFPSPNRSFRVPDDPTAPVIMIGPGTGVAPFRAFLQERRATGASGRNWLFFGERNRAHDFLYGDEFEAMREDGLLTRLDLAFSRDQADKIYVQHRIREQGRELFAWLEEGARLYVCGDATRMAVDVEDALADVVAREGSMTADAADAYLEKLRSEKRYLRDVY